MTTNNLYTCKKVLAIRTGDPIFIGYEDTNGGVVVPLGNQRIDGARIEIADRDFKIITGGGDPSLHIGFPSPRHGYEETPVQEIPYDLVSVSGPGITGSVEGYIGQDQLCYPMN